MTPELFVINPNPNLCPLQSEMANYPLECKYYSKSADPNDVIDPIYPCIKCNLGKSGEITPLTVQGNFPSHHLSNCDTQIIDCDLSFTKLSGVSIRYDINLIKNTNFLASKFFSCVKCLNDKIPVAILKYDSTNKIFSYQQFDESTFSTSTITNNGQSVYCKNPAISADFGLTPEDPNFDIDPNCAMAIINLANPISSTTKQETR